MSELAKALVSTSADRRFEADKKATQQYASIGAVTKRGGG